MLHVTLTFSGGCEENHKKKPQDTTERPCKIQFYNKHHTGK